LHIQHKEYNASQMQRQFLRKLLHDHRPVPEERFVTLNSEIVVAGSYPGDPCDANDIDIFVQDALQMERFEAMYKAMIIVPLGLNSDTRNHLWYNGRRDLDASGSQRLSSIVDVFDNVLHCYLSCYRGMPTEIANTLANTIDHLPKRLDLSKYEIVCSRRVTPFGKKYRRPLALKALNFIQIRPRISFRVGTFSTLITDSFDLHHCRAYLTVNAEGEYECHTDEIASACLAERRLALTTTSFEGLKVKDCVWGQLHRIHKKARLGFNW